MSAWPARSMVPETASRTRSAAGRTPRAARLAREAVRRSPSTVAPAISEAPPTAPTSVRLAAKRAPAAPDRPVFRRDPVAVVRRARVPVIRRNPAPLSLRRVPLPLRAPLGCRLTACCRFPARCRRFPARRREERLADRRPLDPFARGRRGFIRRSPRRRRRWVRRVCVARFMCWASLSELEIPVTGPELQGSCPGPCLPGIAESPRRSRSGNSRPGPCVQPPSIRSQGRVTP